MRFSDLIEKITFEKILTWTIIFQAFIFIFGYICLVVFARINYPYNLEWIEGTSLEQVIRILEGKALYVKPSIEYVPAIYTPLYFYLAALLSKIFGISFFPLRLLSFTASIINFAVIFGFVHRETKDRLAGIIAAGVFAAVFGITAKWFDIGKVDSLFMSFVLISFYLIRYYQNRTSLITAGFFSALAFFTKQSTILIFLPLVCYLIYKYRFKGLYYIITLAFLIIIPVLYFNRISMNWFNYYIFVLPQKHGYNINYIVLFWTNDILKHYSIVFAFAMFYLFSKKKLELPFFYTSMFAGIFLIHGYRECISEGGTMYLFLLMLC